jgi:hypothetical protein
MSENQKYYEHEYADYDMRGEYAVDCTGCGETHTLWTQADDNPEYYTNVNLKCKCGKLVEFNLPVN